MECCREITEMGMRKLRPCGRDSDYMEIKVQILFIIRLCFRIHVMKL